MGRNNWEQVIQGSLVDDTTSYFSLFSRQQKYFFVILPPPCVNVPLNRLRQAFGSPETNATRRRVESSLKAGVAALFDLYLLLLEDDLDAAV